MSHEPSSLQAFLAELKRRHVFRVMTVYGAVAFVVLQVADLAFPLLGLPDWTVRLVLLLSLLGFPIAIVLAWAFDQTPDGLKRTGDAAPGELEAIVAQPASRRWPAGLLALAGVALLFGGGWWMGQRSSPEREINLVVPEAHASEFRTIAVLPFQNVGGDEENRVLASGLHMDLQAQLAGIADLRVTSPMSVREYESSNKGIREIADELGVDHVLQGSVRRSGSTVRVDVQLIDAESDENLWFDQFDREVTPENLFRIQSEIAREVAEQLQAELSPTVLDRLDSGPPSEDLAALSWYHRAREAFLDSGRGGSLPDALEYAETAVELDPQFAEAWAMVARIRALFVNRGEGGDGEALEAVERTEALAPGSVAALTARGYYEWGVEDNREAALSAFRSAEGLAPSDTEILGAIGGLQLQNGDWSESLATVRRAVRLDPQNPARLSSLARILAGMGRYDAADQVWERTLQLDPASSAARTGKVRSTWFRDPEAAITLAAELGLSPDVWEEAVTLAGIAFMNRDFSAADSIYSRMPKDTLYLEEINRLAMRGRARYFAGGDAAPFGDSILAIEKPGLPSGVLQFMQGITYLWKGEDDRAWDLLAEARDSAEASDDKALSPQVLTVLAGTYATHGRVDEALSILEENLVTPGFGFSKSRLQRNPVYDSLRDNPRFEALLERRRAYEEQAARDADAEGPWLP